MELVITELNKRRSIFELNIINITHDFINLAEVSTCFALTIVPLPVTGIPTGGIFDDTTYTEYGALSGAAGSPVNIREFDKTDAYSIKCCNN